MPLQDLTRTMYIFQTQSGRLYAKLGKDIKGLKIAIPKEFYAEGIDDEVRNAVMQAARTYEKMGADWWNAACPV